MGHAWGDRQVDSCNATPVPPPFERDAFWGIVPSPVHQGWTKLLGCGRCQDISHGFPCIMLAACVVSSRLEGLGHTWAQEPLVRLGVQVCRPA